MSDHPDGIAIIGLAGRFPEAPDASAFWRNLVQGRDCLHRFTDEELGAAGYDPAAVRALPGYVGVRGLVDRPEWFDRTFFNIPPREAEVMDPQQRVLLEVGWEALEDSGLDPVRYAGLIGVFAGMSNNTYYTNFVRQRPDLLDAVGVVSAVIANEKDFLATRLAYKLNLRGPALNIQTACSSSLVAVCVACQQLLDHQCDTALAGGVSLTFPQDRGYFYQEGGMTSPDGHCRPFDVRANGTVFSSGAGIVVLKRLADALADGDQIYTVIKGYALNNDGAHKVSFAAPSVSGHAEVIALAQAVAEVAPETISYLEAHGTATPLGDPIEVEGLTQVFRGSTEAREFCALSSVKGNMGHLDAASGVASLIKAALAFRHEQIPPTINCEQPNPALHLEQSPFFLNTALRDWKRSALPRRAGVSSFGVGGTNAHVVLEDAPLLPSPQPEEGSQLLVLSAKTATALEKRAIDLAAHLEANPELFLESVAATLQIGRQVFAHRRFVVAETAAQAIERLRKPERASREETRGDTAVAFLFPGQGSQYAGMGARLYATEPAYREAFDRCAAVLDPLLGLSLRELVTGTVGDLRETKFTQPAIFAVSYALAQYWLSVSVNPTALVGHSVGEFVAATMAGVFTLEDAARLVAERARLVQEQPRGAMLAVRLSEADAQALAAACDVEVAAVNSPRLSVLSGPLEAIERVEAKCAEQGFTARRLETSHAFHSRMSNPVVAPLEEFMRTVTLRSPAIPILSSVTGAWLTAAEATDPGYWARHARATVRFSEAAGALLGHGAYALLECGPGQGLAQLARQQPTRTPQHDFISCLDAEHEESETALAALGRLWAAGVPIDWARLHGDALPRRVSLPSYPFERQRYFADLPAGVPMPLATAATDGEAPREAQAFTSHARRDQPEALPVSESPTADSSLDRVKRVLAELSGLDLAQAAPATGLLELGFDSLFLSQAALSLTRTFGVKIAFRQLLRELGTIGALAEYIASAAPVMVEPAVPAPSAPVTVVGSAPAAHGPFRPLQRDLSGDLLPAQQRWLTEFIARYTRRTAGSKKHTEENRYRLADPRAVSGFKQVWKEMVYQIVVNRSAGTKLWDIDGNEWNDVTLSFGAAMFGHQPPFLQDAITQQLATGMEIGPTSPLAGEVATLLCELTGLDRATFCNTGSEAVVGAVRVARTVTGRTKIAYFAQSYHGIADEVLGRRTATGVAPIAPGIPEEAVGQTLILDYDDPRSLEIIEAHAGELAAVLVEPVQSRHPALQPREFLLQLRALTERKGIALIFDELITGFRCHPGGAQAHFGVRADLATYGKVLGGGVPIGAIAGRAEYMDAFDGGAWQFGDDSFPSAAMTFFAGTFVRHPLALAAARAVLLHLRAHGPALLEKLTATATETIDRINAELAGSPFHVERFASNWLVRTAPDFAYPGLLFAGLRSRAVHVWENRPCFISTAHTAADLDHLVQAFAETAQELEEAGFFRRSGNPFPVALASRTMHGAIPLTESQREVWLFCQLGPVANTACNETWTLRLKGPLNVERIRASVETIVGRHDALRYTFAPSGESLTVQPEMHVPVSLVDLRSFTPEARERDFAELRQGEGRRLFDLEHGPLLALQLVQLGEEEHALVFNAHHLACDGWSCDIFLQELATLYSRDEPLEPALQMSDYQRYAAELHRSPEFARETAYWLERFRPPLAPLTLPGDRPYPAHRTYRGASEVLLLPGDLPATLSRLGAQHGATLFTVLFAAFKTLLFRLTGQGDLAIGVPSAGQNNVAGGDHLIGHCVNLLPIRSELAGDLTFAELLQQLQGTVLEAFEHRDVTYGWLLQNLVIPREPGRIPLIPVVFNVDPPLSGAQFDGLQQQLEVNPRSAFQLDLSLNCDTSSGHLRLLCSYNADILDGATVRRWLGHFRQLLEAAVGDPQRKLSTLPLLAPGERAALLTQWNDTARDFGPAPLLHELFEAQAARTPDAAAVSDEQTSLTFAELNRRADELAGALELGPDVLAGLFFERSVEMVAAMLAVLKAGGTYVPLDPSYPAERLSFMIRDSRMPVILTTAELAGSLPPHEAQVRRVDVAEEWPRIATPVPRLGRPEDLAYVIYTSGSTGTPKGVMISHGAITNYLFWMQERFPLSASDRVLQKAPFSFDASIWEFHLPLITGAELVMARPGGERDSGYVVRTVQERGITVLQAVPAFLEMLSGEPGLTGCSSLRRLFAGGEALPGAVADRFLARLPECELVNLYGPTECTVYVSAHVCSAGESPMPIGRPIANTQFFILDARLQPVPVGVAGELYIAGASLARGYWKNPELTAAKFVEFEGQRVYKTGDLARWMPNGEVDFLGRADHQIKLRGFRIELGEIETALRRIPGIGQCAVVAREIAAGDRRLVAYYTRNGIEPPSPDTLRETLARSLPGYMVPGAFLQLPSFPLTASGKLSLRGLPLPEPTAARTVEGPQNALESQLIEIWQELLGRTEIGTRDNFFELGGHSLLAARMLTLIDERLGRRLEFSALFENPTIEQIGVQLLREQERGATGSPYVAIHAQGAERPFFFLHGDYVGGGFFCKSLARQIGTDRPLYAVHPHGLHGDTPPPTIAAMAADRLRTIRAVQPKGPYLLGGYCNGALVAFEMARMLEDDGEEVSALLMLMADGSNYRHRQLHRLTTAIGSMKGEDALERQRRFLDWRQQAAFLLGSVRHYRKAAENLLQQPWAEIRRRVTRKTLRILRRLQAKGERAPLRERFTERLVSEAFGSAFLDYIPSPYGGPVTLLWPEDQQPVEGCDEMYGWSSVCQDIRLLHVPGEHHSCVSHVENVRRIGAVMRDMLEEVDPKIPASLSAMEELVAV